MTIKDAANRLKVEQHVLRYWELELGLDIKRNELGHRSYDENDIRMFQSIMELKEKGLSLKDIRDAITDYKHKIGKETADEKRDIDEDFVHKDKAKPELVNESKSDIQQETQPEIHNAEYDELKIVDFKTAQLQSIMNKVVANALRENKNIITASLKAEITEDVMKQMDVIMKEQEDREEERFRKLDEVLRRFQQATDEAAATKVKRRFRKKR